MKLTVSAFSGLLQKELLNILDFWINKTTDKEQGGYYGLVLPSGVVVKEANKGAILHGRILWTFSAAYRFTGIEKYRDASDHAFQFLTEYFHDKKNSGVYWETDHRGKRLNTRKQAYAQGFAIYGLSEYYCATGNERSLALAQELFWSLEKHFLDKKNGGYIEALSENWEPLEDLRLSDKDANEPKSMNTHLHLLEPYTNLYRCWQNPVLAESIRKLIRIFLDKIIDPETAHFNLFFGMDWQVKSTAVSYGHDIEGSWLLTEAAEVLEDETLLAEVKEVALRMVEVTLAEGADHDSALFNERDGKHLDSDKHWWPQAEALVGLINAWQLTGDEQFLDKAETTWLFIDQHLIDHEFGEWFWKTDQQGNPCLTDEKAGFWKCPYHNSRALMEAIGRLKKY